MNKEELEGILFMIETTGITNCGGRKQNEDAIRVKQNGNNICLVVADGLGGHGGGQIASSIATDTIIKCYERNGLNSQQKVEEAFDEADDYVKDAQTNSCKMKTTMVMLCVEDKMAWWAHIGDSRLYHFHNGQLIHQTLDHSVSQMAVLMGEITKEEIRFHADRSRILRALGSDSCNPDIQTPIFLEEGFHAFLLCTDGFWEYVNESEMQQLLEVSSSSEKWLAEMELLLKRRVPENHDNYTAGAVFVL